MTWADRISQTIEFTSPTGKAFSAYWIANPRSKEKELGIFKLPKVKGVVVQDLEIAGSIYPLTIYFEGEDHDRDANKFWKACDEAGAWSVNHPTKGSLTLQLMGITEHIDPVTSGNITAFETEWIEPINKKTVMSSAQLQRKLKTLSENANDATQDQFGKNVIVGVASGRSIIRSMVDKVRGIVSDTLSGLDTYDGYLGRRMGSIIRAISHSLADATLDVDVISGQTRNLIQLPSMADATLSTKLSKYSRLISSVKVLKPETTMLESKNKALCQELFMSLAIVGMCKSVAATHPNDVKTSIEAIDKAEFISKAFVETVTVLDGNQDLFKEKVIDFQYFSQTESFSSIYTLVETSVAYLVSSAFSLKKEKRFTLQKPRAPIEIVISEYGNLGSNDELLDQFISNNALYGDEILILPAGREVLVYA